MVIIPVNQTTFIVKSTIYSNQLLVRLILINLHLASHSIHSITRTEDAGQSLYVHITKHT